MYLNESKEKHSKSDMVSNVLDPYHVIYLFPDDGTCGVYRNEPRVRRKFEKFIHQKTTLNLLGMKGTAVRPVACIYLCPNKKKGTSA